MKETYNGHKNWNHWNISLWISNDERLYLLARRCLRFAPTKKQAAQEFLEMVGENKTPDGAPYTVTAILAAMRDL